MKHSYLAISCALGILVTGCGSGDNGSSSGGGGGSTTPTTLITTLQSISISGSGNAGLNIPILYPRQINVTGHYSDGSWKNLTKNDGVTFNISTPNIANISDSGILSGLIPGDALLQVNVNNQSYTSTIIHVKDSQLLSLDGYISEASGSSQQQLSIPQGFSFSVAVAGHFNDDSYTDFDSESMVWAYYEPESDILQIKNPTHLPITEIVAESIGYTELHPCLNTVCSGPLRITVTNATLQSISLSELESIQVNTKQNLVATGNFSDNTTFHLTTQVTWKSSDSSILTVNDYGNLHAYRTGNVTISATRDNITTSKDITVTKE